MSEIRKTTRRQFLKSAVLLAGVGNLIDVPCLLLGETLKKAWFADGYHGGVYGHYPTSFTQFMIDSLQEHPDWNLNLEIEPETWDSVRAKTPEAYRAFLFLAADQSSKGRIEFVNPAYGQSYLWNICGESVIQQLTRGMAKLREHFPNAQFSTYCSEEPCFTSALPGLLKSLGFRAAVLKNPDTCWGGYTRAFGGELVNWIGPDGTAIAAAPRYAIESLQPGSTWQTIAAENSREYIQAAIQSGIEHPIGMCLQDAGWRIGPWLRDGHLAYQPTQYTTWRNYFDNIARARPARDWRLSQEDILVSLVWGAQVLQRVAQQVREGENRILMAEKMATLAHVLERIPWPEQPLAEAWRALLLSQHHDCWIVPYNGPPQNTWADKVARWTGATCAAANQIIDRSAAALVPQGGSPDTLAIRVFNTGAAECSGVVRIALPDQWTGAPVNVLDGHRQVIPSQSAADPPGSILFRASAPSLGFNTYRVEPGPAKPADRAAVAREPNGIVRLESDWYRLKLDPAKGGAIVSLLAKQLRHRELVDFHSVRRFNELRGYFFEQEQFFSTADNPARIEVLEQGAVRVRLQITGQIAAQPVTQWITLVQGEPRIDFRVKIDWRGNPRIGAGFEQTGRFRREQPRRAFYDDRFKLLALFPVNFQQPTIFKDAPFDVTASRLEDTFFDSWSGIKNNVILHWVDLYDARKDLGLALLSDHTTSYTHGSDCPLGLTLQYAGRGLWGRDYTVQGPTEVSYSLLPHRGNHEQARLWTANTSLNQPLVARWFEGAGKTSMTRFSLLTIEPSGSWEVVAVRPGLGGVLVRLFNASDDETTRRIHYRAAASKVELVQLNGEVLRGIPARKSGAAGVSFELALPKRGVGTLRIST